MATVENVNIEINKKLLDELASRDLYVKALRDTCDKLKAENERLKKENELFRTDSNQLVRDYNKLYNDWKSLLEKHEAK